MNRQISDSNVLTGVSNLEQTHTIYVGPVYTIILVHILAQFFRKCVNVLACLPNFG